MPNRIAGCTALVAVTLMCLIALHGTFPATAGEAVPNVSGKWEGTWRTRGGDSGQITLHLLQEGNKVTGKQSVVGVVPLWGTPQTQMIIGEEIRDGQLLGNSTVHFYVTAENVQGQLNFTLTVSGNSMTGTACGYNCATLELKKAPM
jgi:hypothetical protein